MFLFLALFVLGCIVHGPSFETAGMALLGSFVIPPFAIVVMGLVGYVAELWSGKRGAQ